MKKTKLNFQTHDLLVMDSSKIESIAYTDIVAIYCDKPYLIIQTQSKKYIIQHCLNNLIAHLPLFFCQCSKSNILNLFYVQSINKSSRTITTNGSENYQVSRRRILQVWQRFIDVKTAKDKNDICRFCKNKSA